MTARRTVIPTPHHGCNDELGELHIQAMPLLRVPQQVVPEDAPYFSSLSELDSWAARAPRKLTGVLTYHARRGIYSDNQGKLLVG
jgi:hypothetical protein